MFVSTILERFTPPNKLTREPYGTIIKVSGSDRPAYYVQTSTKLSSPKWKTMQMILCSVFENVLGNEEFIDACLGALSKDFNNTSVRECSVSRILEILKKELK